MDVVPRNIEALRGSIDFASQIGDGSTTPSAFRPWHRTESRKVS